MEEMIRNFFEFKKKHHVSIGIHFPVHWEKFIFL